MSPDKENKVFKYATLVKQEIEDAYINQKKTKVFYIASNETKEEVIIEKINPGYEAQIYVLSRFLQLNKRSLSDFKRVIHPLSEFKELDKELCRMDNMQFLFDFADVKTQI